MRGGGVSWKLLFDLPGNGRGPAELRHARVAAREAPPWKQSQGEACSTCSPCLCVSPCHHRTRVLCSLALEVAVITGLPEGYPVPSFLRVSRQECHLRHSVGDTWCPQIPGHSTCAAPAAGSPARRLVITSILYSKCCQTHPLKMTGVI